MGKFVYVDKAHRKYPILFNVLMSGKLKIVKTNLSRHTVNTPF